MNNEYLKKDYLRSTLRLVTAQICQSLGWHGIQRSSLDVLTDLLERYMKQISKASASYCNNYCRTDPNLNDILHAFKDLSIKIFELEDYVHQVEQYPPKNSLPVIPVKNVKSLLSFHNNEQFPQAPVVTQSNIENQSNTVVDAGEKEKVPEETPSITIKNRPKDLVIRADSIESPPYSPLEPKLLNADAQNFNAMTRPGLKVTTPKGYTPTATNSPTIPQTIPTAVSSDADQTIEKRQPITDTNTILPNNTTILANKASYKQDEKPTAGEKTFSFGDEKKSSLLLSPVKKTSKYTKKSPKDKSPKESISKQNLNKGKKKETLKTLSPSLDEKKVRKPSVIPLKEEFISPMQVLQSFEKTEVKQEVVESPTVTSLPQIILSPSEPDKKYDENIPFEKLSPKKEEINPQNDLAQPVSANYSDIKQPSPLNLSEEPCLKQFDSPPPLQPSKSPVILKSESQDLEPPVIITEPPKEMPVLQRNSQSEYDEQTKSPFVSHEDDGEIDIVSTFDNEFRADLLPPSLSHVIANVEEKRKKKKKKSDKDREEKKSKADAKERKEKRKKKEGKDPFAPLKLTLKMGGSSITESESKLVLSRPSPSPASSESTLLSPPNLISPPPLPQASTSSKSTTKKTRKKEKEAVQKSGGFYVETLTSTSVGGEVYYCPGCGRPDDGSPMIGCDNCDQWYHWPCVNIKEEPPEDAQWYCPKCSMGPPAKKKKKKRKKDT